MQTSDHVTVKDFELLKVLGTGGKCTDKETICKKVMMHVQIQRGGGEQWVRTPLKNHKNKGLLSNTGSDPLKNHKATKPAFNIGPSSARQQNAWLADDGQILVVFGSTHQLKKKFSKLDPF